jgi:hypothetical protein
MPPPAARPVAATAEGHALQAVKDGLVAMQVVLQQNTAQLAQFARGHDLSARDVQALLVAQQRLIGEVDNLVADVARLDKIVVHGNGERSLRERVTTHDMRHAAHDDRHRDLDDRVKRIERWREKVREDVAGQRGSSQVVYWVVQGVGWAVTTGIAAWALFKG